MTEPVPVPPPARPGRRARRAGVAVAAAALLLPLLSAGPGSATAGAPPTPGAPGAPGSLDAAFTAAAAEYRVPREVLLGVSYLQSRWDWHGGAPSVAGGYGPMHLTDLRAALDGSGTGHAGHGAGEDRRGDPSRPLPSSAGASAAAAAVAAGGVPARLRTLERAAEVSGIGADRLRSEPAANVRGGAALLADAQRRLGRAADAPVSGWYGAVALFPAAEDAAAARAWADDVFSVIRSGMARTTDSGARITLAADRSAVPSAGQRSLPGLREPRAAGAQRPQCPGTVSCEWLPAPYQELPGGGYGNHDLADRPRSQRVRYIVVHDTEATWETTLRLVRNPAYVSWQYSLRASDGHIAQHVPLKDVAWHAGNWFVNAHSIGLEHEGFLADPDAWYTEAMYRSSARLVRHLAKRYGIPLDRQHIIGHDNVPGTTAATIRGMHTDPGPYWDWDHYFTLLGKPFRATAGPRASVVTIRPDYASHQPVYTGCRKPGEVCAPHGSGAVRLHTGPSPDAPLVRDVGLRPGGEESTTQVNDTGARASTGQRFAVAERRGAWTAIWYLGQKAWFHNPPGRPVAVGSRGLLVTAAPGRPDVPVYGRAYPEPADYPADVPVQQLAPYPYSLVAGQRYVVGDLVRGEYLFAKTFDPSGHRVVRGSEWYYQIQFGHRVAFVKASDVRPVR
ncbi:N-acetylmuramoyl-L-alanine amidase [Streptomyces yaizuensis]|uniref:N-acetylmuramoyl-L-alanine amidase n=1 Tax=Streptomyces yaizuensis TaxID=2989713 RepID=A0ABQ5P2X3_9ACTN|nr:N-acetylmuramoyl-L-alanine amidase [Streptomyces sp. YSPA8]GLF96949.1 N-acetylmuramoyl-L-alanine amidase [Streptomyces sp. YSPA8]